MPLDFDTCYRAVLARDARFDGRFFTGVTSTGVYCRPICPSRTPAKRNVRFFPHAGAAEAAGFRACRRCRPEASPGSPDWNARAGLAARAVRLISDGYVDEHGVSGLAARLAVTERHLRRLLLAELGATPLTLARTIRLQTARRLLAETSLPVTDIAFASGFASIRQFNASFRQSYGRPPTALRDHTPARRRGAHGRGPGSRAGQGPGSHELSTGAGTGATGSPGTAGTGEVYLAGEPVTLRLACREPFDGRSLLRFLAARAIPGVEEVSGSRYLRTIRVPGGAGVIELTLPTGCGAQARLRIHLTGICGIGQVVARCRHLFDLDADPQAIGDALAADSLLAPLVAARPGLRVPGAYDGFELAVRAVLGQQVSVAAAATFAARLAARYGTRLDAAGGPAAPAEPSSEPGTPPAAMPAVLFPLPDDLAEADLSGIGLTTARQATLRSLAAAVAAGRVSLDPGADPVDTAAALAQVPGIGPWTVAYVLMRAVHDPDAFPGTDLGVRRALASLGAGPGRHTLWRPWRAYAALHLWAWDARARSTLTAAE